jgi:uroporphyrinogen III methyltransferase/synthase
MNSKEVAITGNANQPLTGCTILLTRPRNQSEAMAYQLESLGAKVLQAPMIATVAPESWAALDEALKQLVIYHALIFTSANGVLFFFQRLQEKFPKRVTALNAMCVYAIGKATAKALSEMGITADVIAQDSKAEGLLRSIIDHSGGEAKLQGQRFLLPRARIARETLPDELRKLGAVVDAVETYQTIRPQNDTDEILRLLENKEIDVITFTSSSTVTNFVATIGEDKITKLLQHPLIACIGPITTATAQEYKLTNIIQPATYTADALVEIIVEALTRPSQE